MPFGDPVAGGGNGGMLSSFGGLFGKRDFMGPKGQIRDALRALNGRGYFSQETIDLLESLDRGVVQNYSESQAKTKNFAMPILYDGETLPAGVFGKKFEAMPVWKETHSVVDYKTMVHPPFECSLAPYLLRIGGGNRQVMGLHFYEDFV